MCALGVFGVAEGVVPVSLFALEMGFLRVLQGVSGELAAGEVILFVARAGGGQVGVGCIVVKLSGALMSLVVVRHFRGIGLWRRWDAGGSRQPRDGSSRRVRVVWQLPG